MSGVDPDSGQGEAPKPGLYDGKVVEVEHGPSQKGNPMFTIKLEITKGDHAGFNLWHYVMTDGSADFRLREMTDAFGLPPKGAIDTAKLLNKPVQIKVRNQNSEEFGRQAKVSNLLAPGGDADDEDDADYSEMSLSDLKEEVEDRGLEIKGKALKSKLIAALEADDESEEEEEEDGDDGDDDEEADYSEMTLDELKEEAEDRGLELKGRATKAKLVKALEESDESEEDDGDEDDGDNEEEDYTEWSIQDLKDECEARGLKTVGRKQVLIGRLEKSDEDGFED